MRFTWKKGAILSAVSILAGSVILGNVLQDTHADAVPTTINGVQDAVYETADQVLHASDQGTFSVGGMLMDTDGNVVYVQHNNVVNNDLTFDPTAHGERQMIDWYYENKESQNLPEPENIVLVTSLDPCAMCTGSILQAGFSNVVVSANDTYAGINYDKSALFPSLAGTSMQAAAQDSFSYPAVLGLTEKFSRKATGAPVSSVFGENVAIEDQTYALTSTAFDATLSDVSAKINTDLPENELLDPKTLATTDPIYLALKAAYPHALEYTAPSPNAPDEGLAPYLIEAAEQDIANGGDGNAVALLDTFGNLIMALPGNQAVSEIQTPFMLTTRGYAKLRYDLQMNGVADATKYLGHPKYNTFIYAKGMEINPQGLADFGAFGSTMEGAIPTDRTQFQYGVPRATQAELDAFADGLPPFYSADDSVNVHIKQTANQDLIAALEAGLPTTSK
ncbi:nucleoside deaminase [Listeria rustica]|uniref:Nucleoside deaminase n=1 Tax=Listeria rustica TaxID=2713503 RepID=A0A7W1YFB4_9LIST|nr:nucleoside deaminase [Listeria rustica]MBA3925456.1 nucleoside deaminase [Listeria rustica]